MFGLFNTYKLFICFLAFIFCGCYIAMLYISYIYVHLTYMFTHNVCTYIYVNTYKLLVCFIALYY